MRLHVIDGTYELFRAHYAPRPDHRAPDGRDAKATLGVVSSLLALLHSQDEAVTHLAVAFDNPIRSFRNDLFPDYKSDEGVPAELRSQFDAVEEAVRALGIVVWSMQKYEADDAMATAAHRFTGQVEQVRLLTPDKDLGQCLDGTRIVQVDRRTNTVTDEAGFRHRRGFAPASMPDYLALTGDSADGIPGLAGFGAKSASALLGLYGHLESIPERASDWGIAVRGAPKLAATLLQYRAEALLYRQLATLVDAVPLTESLNDLQFHGVPRTQFLACCERLGTTTLKGAPRRWDPRWAGQVAPDALP